MQQLPAGLAAVLANYSPTCQPTAFEPLGSAKGMSGAQFWRLTTPCGDLALRRWPIEHPAPERLRFIHAVLRHAAARGCATLPLPVTTLAGETFVRYAGHLWELDPWMPGTPDYGHAPSVEKLDAAMRTLAQFHIAVATFPTSAAPGCAGGLNVVHRHLSRLRDLSPPAVIELKSSIKDAVWPELAQPARHFLEQLLRIAPRAIGNLEPLSNIQLPLQPCIRDIWHDHILFTGNQVTGVVDFGAVAIDTPATDIARLLGSLETISTEQGEGTKPAIDVWREGIAAYQTARALSAAEIQAAYALDASGTILAGCNWIRWIFIERRTFEDRGQVISRFHRIVSKCAKVR